MGDTSPSQLNLATYLLDQRLAEGRGERVAIRSAAETLTYREVAALSSRCAHLLARADVRPEERVIIALPDEPLFVAALFGILRRGTVVVMVNPDLPAETLRYFVEYTRARAVFMRADRRAAWQDAVADLAFPPSLFEVDSPECQAQLAQVRDDFPTFASHRDDAAIWLFSGGTTGRPKAVVQPHRSFVNTTERYGHGVLKLQEDDITLAVPKLFFGYAMGSNVFFPFSVGASCVLFPERCTPETVFAQIARHRPTVLINVPTMVQQMVAHAGAADQDLSCLRLATSAGEALPAELYARWQAAFGVEMLDGLGRRRCGTSLSRASPARWCLAPWARSCLASRSDCATTRDARSPMATSAHCGSRGILEPSPIGSAWTTPSQRFAASGMSRATCCVRTVTGPLFIAAAPTTC